MGLTLLKEEIAQSVGYKTAQDMIAGDTLDENNKNNGKTSSWFNLAHEVQINVSTLW